MQWFLSQWAPFRNLNRRATTELDGEAWSLPHPTPMPSRPGPLPLGPHDRTKVKPARLWSPRCQLSAGLVPPIPFDFEQAEQAAENRIFKIFPCGATGFGPRGPQKRLEALGKVCSGRGPRLCIKFLARRAKHLMHSMYSFYRKKTLICSYLLAESIFFRSVKKFRKVFHRLFQRAYTDLPTPTEQKVDFWIF